MKTQKQIQTVVLAAVIGVIFSGSAVLGHDITPPPYRGAPLSVYAHWNLVAGSTTLNLTNWSSQDDTDPTTYLYPNFTTPNPQVTPNGGSYDFQIPNWVDNMPIKYLRLQMTWVGTTQSPLNILTQGLDGVNPVVGNITFASTPIILTSGVYQYFDFEYKPNPDFERIHVTLPGNNYLIQTVVDSVSTIPEPATLALLGIGGLAMRYKKRNSVR